MEKLNATQIFESLSSGVRLDIFRLLIQYATNGLVAGEIATKLNLPNTNLSFHLKTLTHSGLITVEQEGRFLRYRANISLMLEVIAYLTEECCVHSSDQCEELCNAEPAIKSFLPLRNEQSTQE